MPVVAGGAGAGEDGGAAAGADAGSCGLWTAKFFGHAHAVGFGVTRGERIERLALNGRSDTLRQVPAGCGEMRAIKRGEGGLDRGGGRGIGIVGDSAEAGERKAGKVAELVAEMFGIVQTGLAGGIGEAGLRVHPVVDGGAVNARGAGGD